MTSRQFFALADQMHRIKARVASERAVIRAAGIGKHPLGTVYRVRKTEVSGYTRRAFVAVRLRRPR